MAKTGMIERNNKRGRMIKSQATKRAALKKITQDRDLSLEERFGAILKLAELPRNSSKVRFRNRCLLTGRPRGYYRKFKISRICLRQLAGFGQLPGVTKGSW